MTGFCFQGTAMGGVRCVYFRRFFGRSGAIRRLSGAICCYVFGFSGAGGVQSFGRAPEGPVSGSEEGKVTRRMLSSIAGVGAVRHMSQCSFSG